MRRSLRCILALFIMVFSAGVVFSEGKKEEALDGKKALNISWFEGGYGRDYLDYAVELFKKDHPDTEVVMDVSPKNHEQLRVRMISGNAPDIFLANESFMDYFALINDDQLIPLNDLLATEAPGGEGTFGDMFLPGILDAGKKNGNYYLAPIFNMFHGLWYSKSEFDRQRWQAPRDYNELLAVSRSIEKSGDMAAFTYQGIYPQYPLRTFFLPSVGVYGGMEALKDLNNLEPGAWKSEAVLKAARDFRDYFRDYGMDGTLALNHTQAQMEFINGRAAMIPCGTWLDNEMKGNWPDGFDLRYLLPPMKRSSDDENYVVMQVMFMAIPSQATNPEAAGDFMKLMYSKELRAYLAEHSGAVMPIRNSTEGIEDKLSPVLVDASRQLNAEDLNTYFASWRLWYKPLFKKVLDSMTEMVVEKITPEEFCEEVEKEAERIRNAPDIVKYRMN